MSKNVSKSSQKVKEKGKRGRKTDSVESKKACLVPTYLKKSELELLNALMKKTHFTSKSSFLRKCFLDYAANNRAE